MEGSGSVTAKQELTIAAWVFWTAIGIGIGVVTFYGWLRIVAYFGR